MNTLFQLIKCWINIVDANEVRVHNFKNNWLFTYLNLFNTTKHYLKQPYILNINYFYTNLSVLITKIIILTQFIYL